MLHSFAVDGQMQESVGICPPPMFFKQQMDLRMCPVSQHAPQSPLWLRWWNVVPLASQVHERLSHSVPVHPDQQSSDQHGSQVRLAVVAGPGRALVQPQDRERAPAPRGRCSNPLQSHSSISWSEILDRRCLCPSLICRWSERSQTSWPSWFCLTTSSRCPCTWRWRCRNSSAPISSPGMRKCLMKSWERELRSTPRTWTRSWARYSSASLHAELAILEAFPHPGVSVLAGGVRVYW